MQRGGIWGVGWKARPLGDQDSQELNETQKELRRRLGARVVKACLLEIQVREGGPDILEFKYHTAS